MTARSAVRVFTLARGNRSKPSGERTDEERERDREERARRRAGEVAKPPEDPPAVEADTPPEIPVEAPAETQPEPVPVEKPALAAPEPIQAEEVAEALPEPVPVEQPAESPPIPPPPPSEPPRPARRDALLEQRRDRLRAGRPSIKRTGKRGGGLQRPRPGQPLRLTRARIAALSPWPWRSSLCGSCCRCSSRSRARDTDG